MSGKPSLLKQLSGAAVGGALALSLYYGYEYGKPMVQAYVTLPGSSYERQHPGESLVNDSTLEKNEAKRFRARNQRVADQLTEDGTPAPEEFKEAAGEEPETIVWPTADDVGMADEETVEVTPTEEGTVAAEQPQDPWGDYMKDTDAQRTQVAEEAPVMRDMEAESLPDSGAGLLLLGFAAVSGAAAVRYKSMLGVILRRA